MTQLAPGDALIVVDMQRDFLPGGALAVPQGDAIVPIVNACSRRFAEYGLPIYFSRDWHPSNHCSFAPHGGTWPPHCVADTEGATFAPGLWLPPSPRVISKATSAERDAYSAFDGTDLAADMRANGVQRIFVCGLATDYCVQATVLDASILGWPVAVLQDAVRAVNVHPGDADAALAKMRRAGALLISSMQLQ